MNHNNGHPHWKLKEGFSPATDNDVILAVLLQHKEENLLELAVENNLEEKERMIMKDDELSTFMKQQEEDETQISME